MLWMAFAIGCTTTQESGWTALREELRQCPDEDTRWVDAFKAARGEEQLDSATAESVKLIQSCEDAWQPIWFQARVRLELEQIDEALAGFESALRHAESTHDDVGIARAADQLGWIRFMSQDFDAGRGSFQQAIEAAVRAERRDLEGFARNNLAGLLVEEGNYSLASRQLEDAAFALERAGRADAAVGLAYNRAALLLELGDAVSARTALEDVHRQAEAMGDLWTVQASAVVLGNLHLALRQPDAAASWFNRVGTEADDLNLLSRLGLGRVASAQGDFDEAVERLTPVATLSGEEQALFAGMATIFLADAELSLGRTDDAEGRLGPWTDRTIPTSAPAEVLWGARWMLGRIRLQQGRNAEAVEELKSAIDGLEATGASLDPLTDGLRFLRQRREPYVDLAIAQSRDSNSTSSAELLATLSRAQARALQRSLRDQAPAKLAELSRIQMGLRSQERILNYLIGEERGLVLSIGAGSVVAYEIAGLRKLAAPLSRARLQLTDPAVPNDPSAFDELRTELLQPLARELSGVTQLYVVPDGPLATIPFAVLLPDTIEVAWLPVAGTPDRMRRSRSPLLLAGSPQFAEDSEFSPLPWSAFELSKLRDLWGTDSTTLITGDELTLERLAPLRFEDFGTIHFATHALASTVDPQQCGVVLSDERRLGIDRIADLQLEGSLVVLSACRTGEGELIPGEGIVGLGWAFLRAGASGVVTSLWSVDDAVSAKLMVEFHRRLAAGDDPTAALAAARRKTAERWPDPGHWASFVIVLRPNMD